MSHKMPYNENIVLKSDEEPSDFAGLACTL